MTMTSYQKTSRGFRTSLSGAWVLLVLGIAALPAPTQAAPALFEQTTLTVSVSEPDRTADSLITRAQNLDGYFTYLSDQTVTVRIPSTKSAEFITYCETLGTVLERRFETTGFDEALNQKRTRLKTKQEILERYLAVLKSSKKKTIVSVERAVQEVVADIESLKGSIAFMEHELAFARVTVQFQFKDRNAPVYSGTSSFPWLNTLNLNTMIEDFNHEK